MRAKFKVIRVEKTGETTQQLEMVAVTDKEFDSNGNSEDNSFARWTPCGKLLMDVSNPSLMGALKVGENYYLDFTQAK
jgi:hypothetical protein